MVAYPLFVHCHCRACDLSVCYQPGSLRVAWARVAMRLSQGASPSDVPPVRSRQNLIYWCWVGFGFYYWHTVLGFWNTSRVMALVCEMPFTV